MQLLIARKKIICEYFTNMITEANIKKQGSWESDYFQIL
jgi:hypothetical protein